MDNTEHTTGRAGHGTAGAARCGCCGRRDARRPLHPAAGPGGSAAVAVCPYCDLQEAEIQGWLDEFVRNGG